MFSRTICFSRTFCALVLASLATTSLQAGGTLITASPDTPDSCEEVTVTINVTFPTPCWDSDVLPVTITEDSIVIDIDVAPTSPICVAVLDAREFVVAIGTLEAGDYDIDVNFVGSPPTSVQDGSSTLTVDACGTTFRRGDIDNNGIVSPLLDGLALLSWAFADGDAPSCEDAADVDGNDVVAPLIDTLSLLLWGFGGGEVPADPGPEECGLDPTDDDDVDCAESACV